MKLTPDGVLELLEVDEAVVVLVGLGHHSIRDHDQLILTDKEEI